MSCAAPRRSDAPVAGELDDGQPRASCSRCDAVCCRLTVVILPGDRIPAHLTTRNEQGLEVMARDPEGWCVAIDPARMCCSIYESRPTICRSFAMDGPYCRDIRRSYQEQSSRRIPLTMY